VLKSAQELLSPDGSERPAVRVGSVSAGAVHHSEQQWLQRCKIGFICGFHSLVDQVKNFLEIF